MTLLSSRGRLGVALSSTLRCMAIEPINPDTGRLGFHAPRRMDPCNLSKCGRGP